jgi:hypothetical protein
MNTLKEIYLASPHLKEILKERMAANLAFKRIALAKEFDTQIGIIQEAVKGKTLSKEEEDTLLSEKVEIKNLIPKSELTFDISPVALLALEPFLID